MTCPGLVDDGRGRNCIVSSKWRASYTTIVTVDMDGVIQYRKDFPNNFSGAYSGLDRKIEELLPAVDISYQKKVNFADMKILFTTVNGDMFLTIPEQVTHTFQIFDMAGRNIITQEKSNFRKYNISDLVPAGNYIIKLTSEDNNYVTPIVISE
jgi:hypothetical protein